MYRYRVSARDASGNETSPSVEVAVITPPLPVQTNHAPMAVADSLSAVRYNAKILDVLANDSDPDADSLTVTSVTQGIRGSVSISNNQVRYKARGKTGTDSFSYTISDGNGGTATATVAVTVKSR